MILLKILKGYVFRMYPNIFQKELIEKSFGCSRFIYNYYLNDKQREYKENGKSKTAYDHRVAKSLTHIPLSEIIEKLKYKSKYSGKYLIQIDRYYPSSQTCSRCNYQNKEVKDLRVRKWEWTKCHTIHDRDYNRAENILYEGLKKYMNEITKIEQSVK